MGRVKWGALGPSRDQALRGVSQGGPWPWGRGPGHLLGFRRLGDGRTGVDQMGDVEAQSPGVSQAPGGGGGRAGADARWAASASDTELGVSGEQEMLAGKWLYG